MDPARIADLRRRLQADPSSIAFAQLAEEHRRAGQFDEAVAVCREGLLRHPGYLSARITLGRALVELGGVTEAEHEFEVVLRSAPDNLAAIRGIADTSLRRGNLHRALAYYRRAQALAKYDPDLDETVERLAQQAGRATPVEIERNLSFAEAEQELLNAPARVPSASLPKPSRVDFDEVLQSLGVKPDAPAPRIVEAWLSGSSPLPAPAPPASASASDGPAADLLAELERELRQLETRKPSPGETSVSHTDRQVIAALERWLEAIADRRQALSKTT